MRKRKLRDEQQRLNAITAYRRDSGFCRWCLHKLKTHSSGETPHHIFGHAWDGVQYQITLCGIRRDGSMGCHRRVHAKGDITRQDIVELAIETIWGGKNLTPAGR